MNPLNTLEWVALILVVVGGVNWGLIAVANIDLVAMIFGDMSLLSRVVYGLVGASAVYAALMLPKLRKQ